MQALLFIKDDFLLNNQKKEKIVLYLKKYISDKNATLFLSNASFYNKIENLIKKEKEINKFKIEIVENEDEYENLILNSELVLIDENLTNEIAYKYIPYSFNGEFIYI